MGGNDSQNREGLGECVFGNLSPHCFVEFEGVSALYSAGLRTEC